MQTEHANIPPGLQAGGSWLPAIRAEIRNELIGANFLQVKKPLPPFLRWLLGAWLHR